ncbi:MAG: hypothetical protein ACFFD2_15380 [Promethearchaeota archaeon]
MYLKKADSKLYKKKSNTWIEKIIRIDDSIDLLTFNEFIVESQYSENPYFSNCYKKSIDKILESSDSNDIEIIKNVDCPLVVNNEKVRDILGDKYFEIIFEYEEEIPVFLK